jgi:hypothetical protein
LGYRVDGWQVAGVRDWKERGREGGPQGAQRPLQASRASSNYKSNKPLSQRGLKAVQGHTAC